MGGKSSTSTQSVQIPPDVLARYNSVNDQAQQAAGTPFQQYSTSPDAFVAPLNSTQNAGVAGSNAYANTAQPYYSQAYSTLGDAQSSASPYINAAYSNISAGQNIGSGLASASLDSLNAANANAAPLNSNAGKYYQSAFQAAQPYNAASSGLIGQGLGAAQPLNSQAASGYSSALQGAQPYNSAATGLAAASAGAVDPSQLNVGQYMSPYLQSVLGSTAAQLQQDNGAAMSGQTGNAIQQGAFGGDRAGIAAANLQRQQTLANNQIYSNILNTGYNNALGAAQQQQGVGLGAAQANRSALGSAAGQLASIGQQQYGQGTGTAAAQAALGNQEYSQGLGAASAVQGLGQQVYGQGTGTGTAVQGLGQQVFGQGLATSQQQSALSQQQFEQAMAASQAQAGLGNQMYTMGANTSAAQAGLGTAAQAAGLQGAQAQLAAGQVGQQTQQAGDTALYNQFLQQQSYPFQVDQFLANIAEGTGSLSGSTTTTSQPGGFFSDERLKENIRKIGETFDRQPIYSYNYKGDGKTQIGLIAQKVEKSHPDAVGSQDGYRTVDYGKATHDAAKRGHFAGGGAPLLPGLSSTDMAALLQAQQQMYSPFSKEGGLYGSAASGSPRGGSSYVPSSSVPVSHLTVAGDLPQQKTGLDRAKEISDLASKSAPYVEKGVSWAKGKLGSDDDTMDVGSVDLARGGVAGYADGGMPYSTTGTLDIPDEKADDKLSAPGSLPGQKSGLSNAKDAATTAIAAAKLAAMFYKGGRVGKDDGGEVAGGDDTPVAGPFYESAKPHTVASKPALIGTMDTDSRGDRYWNPMGKNVDVYPARDAVNAAKDMLATPGRLAAPIVDKILGSQQHGASASWDDAPSNVVTHPAVHRAIAAAKAMAPSSRNPTIGETPETTIGPAPDVTAAPAGLAAANTNISTADLPQAASMNSRPDFKYQAQALADKVGLGAGNAQGETATGHPMGDKVAGLAGKLRESLGTSLSDYVSGLKHGDAQSWLPLLSGIAAMGTAQTVHPGVALAAGLGAGAQSYMGTKKSLADVARTEAGTGQIGAQTTQAQQANSINFYKLMQAGLLKADPSGTIIDPATGTHYSNTQAPEPTVGGSPAPTFRYLGQNGQTALQKSAHQYIMDSPGIGLTPNAGNIETSNKIINDVQRSASDAQTAKTIQNEQAAALLSTNRKGILSQGALAPVFQPYVEKFNSLVSDAGHPEWAISGLGDQQIAHKLQLGQAALQSTGAGQHAYQALNDFTQLAPGGALDPKAAATLMAQNAIAATKAIDQRNALDEAKQSAPNGNYEAQDIMTAFDRDNPPAVYNAMRDAVAGIYQNPAYAAIHEALAKPGSPEYQKTVNTLNAYGAQHGIPNFARVFTGG